MASAARLERLRKMVQPDLDALPDKSAPEPVSDEEDGGGVSLDLGGGLPLEPTPVDPPSKQTARHSHATLSSTDPDRRFVWVQDAASTYNPKTVSSLPTIKLPPVDLRKGDLAPAREYFTPISALAKYPYKFANKNCMQDIASHFFDAGKFWNREWDLYYVWDIEPSKPLVLVKQAQFEDLLKEINSVLNLGLNITNQQREDGLVSRFPDHPRCLPRYLGRSNSREEFDNMVGVTPSATFRAPGEAVLPPLTGHTLEDFKQMMEEMWDLQSKKSKAQKEKKKQERVVKQQGLRNQFKRAQRYLGLRPTAQNGTVPQVNTSLNAVDPSLPAPFAFDRSVVFVCVDVESYERAHNKITEIGVATLDTRELDGVAPGKDGENWRSKIRARHFRIEEYKHLKNHEFVAGCPDRFDFGKSEFVRLNEAVDKIGACFEAPFCALSQNDAQGSFISMMETVNLGEQRNLIFLGHDTLTDIKYLQDLGYNPLDLPNLLEALDTAALYRVWRREPNITNLGRILYDFDIAGWNLHNAGNDAVFTVQAMLGVCVREATIRGSPELEAKHSDDKAARLAALTAEAQQRAQDDAEDWSDVDEKNDGGAPEPISSIKVKPKSYSTPVDANLRTRNNPAISFDIPNPTRGRGRGRGRGSSMDGLSGASNAFHARVGYQSSDSYGTAPTSGYHHRGRPRALSGDRGYSRGGGGRTRARRASVHSEDGPSSGGVFISSPHQVRHDLIDL